MKKLVAILLLLAWSLSALGVEKSQNIVYINGAKYYIHTVQAGETLYALSKEYRVGEQVIVEHNPTAAAGLKKGEAIKIPFVAEYTEQLSEKKMRKTFDTYSVAKGETLYAISRKYQIPVQSLIADNPGVDPIHLSLGQKLLIRKQQIGTEAEEQNKAQWEEYRQSLNSVVEAGYAYHMVRAGETFYSLSRRFGLTEKELSELNNGLKAADLKVGAILKVPGSPEQLSTTGGETAVTETVAETPVVEQLPAVHFRSLRRGETINIALLLPMSANNTPNASYMEFYQGFLLGLDSAKTKYGCSVNLELFNTNRSPEKVREIIDNNAFRKANLIVGPVYEEELLPVIQFAEQQQIPVVSPLAHIGQLKSNALFQLAPDPARKAEKLAAMVGPEKQVTLIYSGSTDKEFEQEMLSVLGTTRYSRYTYKYEHPNQLARRGADYVSPSDLTPLLDNGQDNVFVVMSDNEIDTERILTAIASANTGISSRGRLAPRFVVLGNARWNRYPNLDRTMLFQNRVIFISTYHAKRDSQLINNFDSSYLRAFGSLPTLFSYRGYDAAMLFTPAMYGEIEYNLQSRQYTPLQTPYRFDQGAERGNHINTNWVRVTYNTDFTISIE